MPWVAVPRLVFEGKASPSDEDTLDVRRSSAFAARGQCTACDSVLFIRYDCEEYTDWVHADAMRISAPAQGGEVAVPYWCHIHRDPLMVFIEDGLSSSPSFEPWEADPCRPTGTPEPVVCMKCFQRIGGACQCGSGSKTLECT